MVYFPLSTLMLARIREILVISAPEEIAYLYEWIDRQQLGENAARYGNSPYGKHLKALLEDRIII